MTCRWNSMLASLIHKHNSRHRHVGCVCGVSLEIEVLIEMPIVRSLPQFLHDAWKSTVNCNFQAYNRKAPSEFIQVIGTCHLVFVAPVDFTSRQAKTSKFRTNSRGAHQEKRIDFFFHAWKPSTRGSNKEIDSVIWEWTKKQMEFLYFLVPG